MYSGDTGFILAAEEGHLNILEFLLTKGFSVDEKDDRYGKIQPLKGQSITENDFFPSLIWAMTIDHPFKKILKKIIYYILSTVSAA